MTAMDELTAAKTTVRNAMLKGTTGSLRAERVEEQLADYQRALRKVHAARLADTLRAKGNQLGHNTRLAYHRAAALIEETETS